jgi:MFS family permease
LLYYAASAFFTIYWATVFKDPSGVNLSTAQANSLNAWFWWADIVALILFGILSDLLKVRKPLMLAGAIGSIIMLILFINAADNPHSSLDTLILLEVALAACISLCYAPWMAGYTEMVEARNPALVGTGLALWGWILRLTVGLSFIFLPLVVNSVNPVVNNLQYAQTPPNGHAPFNVQPLSDPKNAAVVAAAHANPLAGAAALTRAVGPVVFGHVLANLKEVNGPVYTYRVELGYLAQHQDQLVNLLNGVGKSPRQWQNWFWVCLGGMVLFIPTIWLNRGRWNPAKARADEKQHEAEVEAEYKQLVGARA